MTEHYRCPVCEYSYKTKRQKQCDGCKYAKLALSNFIYNLRKHAEFGCLSPADVDHINRLIAEYLATHWTERENPRHEVMEAVCSLVLAA